MACCAVTSALLRDDIVSDGLDPMMTLTCRISTTPETGDLGTGLSPSSTSLSSLQSIFVFVLLFSLCIISMILIALKAVESIALCLRLSCLWSSAHRITESSWLRSRTGFVGVHGAIKGTNTKLEKFLIDTHKPNQQKNSIWPRLRATGRRTGRFIRHIVLYGFSVFNGTGFAKRKEVSRSTHKESGLNGPSNLLQM